MYSRFHLIIWFLIMRCVLSTPASSQVNGVHIIPIPEAPFTEEGLEAIKTIQANWVSIVPMSILDRVNLNFERYLSLEQLEETIRIAKASGFKIMLKPQFTLQRMADLDYPEKDKTNGAVWRGDLMFENEADWKALESKYEQYLFAYVDLAIKYNIELFCIGTEQREFAVQREHYWRKLIGKIRGRYSGELTYSANWDEYSLVTFWDQLDYIGIDAYFPISESKTPKISELLKNWSEIKSQIFSFSKRYHRTVVFTEYGYRNVSYAGKEPWTHNHGYHASNLNAQTNLFAAFFESFWKEEWVSGGFCWNWSASATNSSTTDFNINNKPVMGVVKRWYGY